LGQIGSPSHLEIFAGIPLKQRRRSSKSPVARSLLLDATTVQLHGHLYRIEKEGSF
jgi:hypothetical protein